jgi:hypothetical protein
MYCNVISMCNITCIYNEICHITNEIFQAQITSHGGDGGFEAYLGGLVHSGPLVVGVVVEQQIRNTLVLVELQEVLELALFGEKAEACEESPVLRQQQDCDGRNV